MKTPKLKIWKLLSLAFSITTIMGLAACGKKSNPNAAVVNPGYLPGGVPVCSTCAGGGAGSFLVSSLGQFHGSDDVSVQFDFFAQGAVAPTTYQPGQFAGSIPYQGPMMAQGVIYIGRPLIACNIPAGAYQLRSVQPGMFGADGTGRSVEGLALQGVNGAVMVQLSGYISVQAPPAVGRDGRQYPSRLTANMRVSRSDGQSMYPCDFTIQ